MSVEHAQHFVPLYFQPLLRQCMSWSRSSQRIHKQPSLCTFPLHPPVYVTSCFSCFHYPLSLFCLWIWNQQKGQVSVVNGRACCQVSHTRAHKSSEFCFVRFSTTRTARQLLVARNCKFHNATKAHKAVCAPKKDPSIFVTRTEFSWPNKHTDKKVLVIQTACCGQWIRRKELQQTQLHNADLFSTKTWLCNGHWLPA